MEIILTFLTIIILWFSSIYMLSNWKGFKNFLFINGILIIAYVVFITNEKNIFGHDEYGLGLIYRLSLCLLSHVIIVFLFALFKKMKK